jgi:hypothetical protein
METLVPEYGVSQLGARPMGVEKSDLLKFLAESSAALPPANLGMPTR